MRKIKLIAGRYNLRIIEDAAHAIEASRDGIRPGDLSDAACFSFYATKNITSGEGGAVSTNNKTIADSIKVLRLHGIDKDATTRYTKYYEHWDMAVLGWKYNMDNIQASLLISQLQRIEELWKKREHLWNIYIRELENVKGVKILRTIPESRHARHLFTALVPAKKRDSLLVALQKRGIGVAVNYRPIHLLKYYRKTFGFKKGDYPVSEKIGRTTISLPFYPGLEEKDIRYVVKILKEELKK